MFSATLFSIGGGGHEPKVISVHVCTLISSEYLKGREGVTSFKALDVIYSGKIGEPGLLDLEMVKFCKLFYVLTNLKFWDSPDLRNIIITSKWTDIVNISPGFRASMQKCRTVGLCRSDTLRYITISNNIHHHSSSPQ